MGLEELEHPSLVDLIDGIVRGEFGLAAWELDGPALAELEGPAGLDLGGSGLSELFLLICIEEDESLTEPILAR